MDTITTKNIRALSWKAPFGQLMLRGKIETRTWPTNYRGYVLICCSKTAYSGNALLGISGKEQLNRILKANLSFYSELGMAIAIGKLVDCRPMTLEDENPCYVQFKEPWAEDKTLVSGKVKQRKKQLWCHVYEDVRPIRPFPFKGGQGWRKLNNDQLSKIVFI